MEELYRTLPDLVQYEVYGFIKEEVELIRNWTRFQTILETFKKSNENITVEAPKVDDIRDSDREELYEMRATTPIIMMELYDTCFPEDQIYDVFSPSDTMREMIATDTVDQQVYNVVERPSECEEWRDAHNMRFECLRRCPNDYFYFSRDYEYYGDIIYEWRWLHTDKTDRQIMSHFFYEDMKKIIIEKLENPKNYASLYNLYLKCEDEVARYN